MDKFVRRSLAAAVTVLAGAVAAPALAGSNPAIGALQQTPVSLFSQGLNNLDEGINAAIGRGKTPPSFAMFKAPLSGKIADMANVIYDDAAGTITVNLVRIEKIDIEADAADEACVQGIVLLRLLAELDPATGQLQGDMKNSGLSDYFSVTGTTAKSPADLATLDQAFRFRFVFNTDVGHFECAAPMLGAAHTLKKMAY